MSSETLRGDTPMPFDPIEIDDYIRKHLRNNPSDDPGEIRSRLEAALAACLAGRRCDCGEPIWVIGSAVAHYACFTCITGEAIPDNDYEIAAACRPTETGGVERRTRQDE